MKIRRQKKARKQKKRFPKGILPFFLFPGMANSVKPFFTHPGIIVFYRFYADRSNNASRVLIARRLCSIWLCPYRSRVILAEA